VAFEESSARIMSNAASFNWKLPAWTRQKKLLLLDAQPSPDLVHAGDSDLIGMLAVLEA